MAIKADDGTPGICKRDAVVDTPVTCTDAGVTTPTSRLWSFTADEDDFTDDNEFGPCFPAKLADAPTITNATAAECSFTPTVDGEYVIKLVRDAGLPTETREYLLIVAPDEDDFEMPAAGTHHELVNDDPENVRRGWAGRFGRKALETIVRFARDGVRTLTALVGTPTAAAVADALAKRDGSAGAAFGWLSAGANPADAGEVRVPFEGGVYAKNEEDDGTVPLITLQAGDRVQIGGTVDTTIQGVDIDGAVDVYVAIDGTRYIGFFSDAIRPQISAMRWLSTTTPIITQAQRGGTGANAGAAFEIRGQQGQNVSGGTNNDGGNMTVGAGLPGTGGSDGIQGNLMLDGYDITVDAADVVNISIAEASYLKFFSDAIRPQVDEIKWLSTATPVIGHAKRSGTGANAGATMTVRGQDGQDVTGGANNDGGDVDIGGGEPGTGGSGGARGRVLSYGVPVMLGHSLIKSADQTVSSTTLDDDDDLSFPIEVVESWSFEFVLKVNLDADGGFKFAIVTPDDINGGILLYGYTDGLGSVAASFNSSTAETGIAAGNADTYLRIIGSVLNGENAGSIKLQFAENSGGGGAAVKAGSYLVARKSA